MLTKVIENVLDKWKSEGLELALPNSEKEITRIFAKIGKKISKDIIQLYSTIGGNSNGRMDNNLLSFWTLEDLIEENSKQKTDFTLFADYSIFCCLYAFNYENENISSVYSNFETGEFLKIADSVEEFLSLYLTNPIEIGLYEE